MFSSWESNFELKCMLKSQEVENAVRPPLVEMLFIDPPPLDVTFSIWLSVLPSVCSPCTISQEPYIIWSSFSVHMCKMMVSPGVFFFFKKKLFFWTVGGSKRAKNRPKWKITITSVTCAISQEQYSV